MRAGGLAALALLGGCAFGAESALFAPEDGVAAFADASRWTWVESAGERIDIVFHAEGEGRYTIAPTSGQESLPGVIFTPIAATPEEDYIAQLRLGAEADGVVLAFLWRTETGYRAVVDPGPLTREDDLSAADPFCVWQDFYGCGLESREAAFGVYEALIHPRFVVGQETPESYIDIVPAHAAAFGEDRQ